MIQVKDFPGRAQFMAEKPSTGHLRCPSVLRPALHGNGKRSSLSRRGPCTAEIFAIAALLGIAFYYLYPPESGQRQA